MKNYRFVIFGIPAPKQSARFMSKNGKIISYQDSKVVAKSSEIRMQVLNTLKLNYPGFKIIDRPIEIVSCMFFFNPPKSIKKSLYKAIETGMRVYKATKPDLPDNLMKGLCDALQGIFYTNDSLIYGLGETRKVYTLGIPRVEIEFSVREDVLYA